MIPARGLSSIVVGVLLLALAATGCDSGKHRVEALPAPADGRTVIRVVASDESATAFRKISDEYATRREIVFEIVQAQTSDIPGIIRKGGADLGITGRKLDPVRAGSELNYVPFAWDGAVFVAGAGAGVSSLTSRQIVDIYAGRLTNWKQAGGRDLPIRVVDRPPYSTMRMAASSIAGSPLAPPGKLVVETSEAALHALRTIEGAFACVPVSRTLTEKLPVVSLTIDGKSPLLSVEKGGGYPARLEFAMLFRKDVPESVKEIANHLVSVEGIHQITSLALLPAAGNIPIASCHCRASEGAASPLRKSALSGVLTIGITPELGAIAQEKRYVGIAQAIAEQLDVETRVRHLLTYDDVVHAFKEGRVDAAFVGSLAYARLHTQVGVVALARPESDGVSWYRGSLIVPSASSVRRFADLRGKRFAYVPDTSAGELFLRDLCVKAGGGPVDAWFGHLIRARSHADAVHMVAEGKADGAAVKDLVLRRIRKSDPDVASRVREIDRSPTFPENALVVSPSMNERQQKVLRELLLGLHKDELGRDALSALGAERFVTTNDADYSSVYQLSRDAGYPLVAP
jgi:phosphonate transport system substrate-binding protein